MVPPAKKKKSAGWNKQTKNKIHGTRKKIMLCWLILLYNSMSSSPELLNRGLKDCSWDGGLLTDGTGVGVCLLLRCCLCKESLSLCVSGSSGGRQTTSSIQERLTDCATICGRISPIPRCRPSLKLSDITNTGLRWDGSTSSSSSSLSSSRVILSSISCSLLWAASTSMPEPSEGTLGNGVGAVVKGRFISSIPGLVCSWTRLVSAEGEDAGESTGQMWLALGLGHSSAPSSPISFRRLGLQLSSSVLLLCFLMHLLSQLVFGIDPPVRWCKPLVGPLTVTKSGLLKCACGENMMKSSSLLPDLELCIVLQLKMSWRHQN